MLLLIHYRLKNLIFSIFPSVRFFIVQLWNGVKKNVSLYPCVKGVVYNTRLPYAEIVHDQYRNHRNCNMLLRNVILNELKNKGCF